MRDINFFKPGMILKYEKNNSQLMPVTFYRVISVNNGYVEIDSSLNLIWFSKTRASSIGVPALQNSKVISFNEQFLFNNF